MAKGELTEVRFWSKVAKGPDCWDWVGARTAPGWHGRFAVDGTRAGRTMVMAHRYSWELAYGPIPAGLSVLHSCDNPGCVRPGHLMVGTQRANIGDASRKGRMKHVIATQCKRGHLFEGNTYIHPSTKRRMCHTCHVDRARRWHEGQRASEVQDRLAVKRLGRALG
jgi:hypothetical protein